MPSALSRRSHILLSSCSHRFAMGFRSNEHAGEFKVDTPSDSRNSLVSMRRCKNCLQVHFSKAWLLVLTSNQHISYQLKLAGWDAKGFLFRFPVHYNTSLIFRNRSNSLKSCSLSSKNLNSTVIPILVSCEKRTFSQFSIDQLWCCKHQFNQSIFFVCTSEELITVFCCTTLKHKVFFECFSLINSHTCGFQKLSF